jgi:hypothetical protein
LLILGKKIGDVLERVKSREILNWDERHDHH